VHDRNSAGEKCVSSAFSKLIVSNTSEFGEFALIRGLHGQDYSEDVLDEV